MAENQEATRMVSYFPGKLPVDHMLMPTPSCRLVCAKRRLTWKEIQVALSIDMNSRTIDYENQHLRDHIYDTCGSLVLVSGDRVSLVHSTAKTYVGPHMWKTLLT